MPSIEERRAALEHGVDRLEGVRRPRERRGTFTGFVLAEAVAKKAAKHRASTYRNT